jgi:hypothetical protein
MKSTVILFTIVCVILLSSCRDDTTSPPPTTDFSAKITIKNQVGAPVAGLRISAWNHLPPGIPLGSQMTPGGLASPLSVSSIEFSVATPARINLSVFEFDGSPVSTLVDQPLISGLYRVNWSNPTEKPPRVYRYRLIARDTAVTAAILFRDSLYAVLWHWDPEIAVLGWSSSAGTFETSDKLLFPNVLDLPKLVHTSLYGPDSLGTFTIPDSVTFALTDTVTHRQMTFDRVIRKGVANEIELIWNPILSKQWVPPHPSTTEQQSIIRSDPTAAVLFNWKLYQNYPNPYN